MEKQFELEALIEEANGVVRRQILHLAGKLSTVLPMRLRPVLVENIEQYRSPLRDSLRVLVAVANNEAGSEAALRNGDAEAALMELLELLLARPYTNTYDIPDYFWTSSTMGELCSVVQNKIWSRSNELLTYSQAAQVMEPEAWNENLDGTERYRARAASRARVERAVEAGELASYIDQKEQQPARRKRVRRGEVEALADVRQLATEQDEDSLDSTDTAC